MIGRIIRRCLIPRKMLWKPSTMLASIRKRELAIATQQPSPMRAMCGHGRARTHATMYVIKHAVGYRVSRVDRNA